MYVILVFWETHDSSKKIIFHEFHYTFSITMTVVPGRRFQWTPYGKFRTCISHLIEMAIHKISLGICIKIEWKENCRLRWRPPPYHTDHGPNNNKVRCILWRVFNGSHVRGINDPMKEDSAISTLCMIHLSLILLLHTICWSDWVLVTKCSVQNIEYMLYIVA